MKKSASNRVDVIIPTYNGLPWLREAVDSVLSQTHKNLRLLIIDDGSTDDTKTYVSSIRDDRVNYIYQQNSGQATARNQGIAAATAPYIAFLDADDYWLPTKLEKQLKVMEDDSKVGLVYGHIYVIEEDGIIARNLRALKRGAIADDLAEGNLITGSASMVLVRKSILDKTGGFKTDLVNGEDWELWLRIAMLSQVDFVPEILAAIRQHDKSTQANTKRMADGLVYAYKVMRKELELSKEQLHKVAFYCLFNASNQYLSIGLHKQSRRAMLLLFKEHPRMMARLDLWKPRYHNGIYVRTIFGNPVADFVSKLIRFLLNLPFRLAKKIIRSLRQK